MPFYIVVIGLSCLIMALLVYRKYSIEIELQETSQFQGVQLRARLPLYTFEQIYDYSDPQLNLLESMLLDRLDKGFSGKVAFDWGVLRRFLISVSRIKLFSNWERQSIFTEKILAFTVIKNCMGKALWGGDAMYCLMRGYLGCQGLIVAYIHNQ